MVGMGCWAQTTYSLYDGDRNIQGAYYKDLDNDLNNFVGTWKYTNGTTSLTITLQKKEMAAYVFSFSNISYYEDVLVGGYKYVENGVEKINTLPQIQLELPNSYNYPISGNIILSPPTTNCEGCLTNMRAVYVGFSDPTREIFGMESKMIFARADSGGVQKLLLKFKMISGGLEEDGEDRPYDEYTVPFGDYLLVKQ